MMKQTDKHEETTVGDDVNLICTNEFCSELIIKFWRTFNIGQRKRKMWQERKKEYYY